MLDFSDTLCQWKILSSGFVIIELQCCSPEPFMSGPISISATMTSSKKILLCNRTKNEKYLCCVLFWSGEVALLICILIMWSSMFSPLSLNLWSLEKSNKLLVWYAFLLLVDTSLLLWTNDILEYRWKQGFGWTQLIAYCQK